VVRGLQRFVLPRDEAGPGAAALVRPEAGDLFGYGAREAVLRALVGGEVRGFGAPVSPAELRSVLATVLGAESQEAAGLVGGDGEAVTVAPGADDARTAGRAEAVAVAVARAHGWRPDVPRDGVVLRFTPITP
jgi:coenzyme F420-0:L-glutamate ligase/coenzyme F420-1:gamma-L-glutamate ligase